jgi:ketosteroid isomerase-like protein
MRPCRNFAEVLNPDCNEARTPLRFPKRANAKSLDAQVCHVFKVRDGKVTSFQQFVDTAQLQDALGAR